MAHPLKAIAAHRPRPETISRTSGRVRATFASAARASRRIHARDAAQLGLDRVLHFHPTSRTLALAGVGSAATVAAGTAIAVHFAHRGHVAAREFDSYRVCPLSDLRGDDEALAVVQRELVAEWGPFAPADMDEMRLMVKNAGERVFVIHFAEDDAARNPVGVLQTALADVHGDPDLLAEAYPTFGDITDGGTWRHARKMKGDTVLLLQITAFGERSRGVGSLLRDAALYMLPASVKFALTTTPVEGAIDPEGAPESLPAPVRFHYRGGARPAGFAAGYKRPDPARTQVGRQANRDVVFMRYVRRPDGDWEGVARPPAAERRGLAALFAGLHLPRPGMAPAGA